MWFGGGPILASPWVPWNCSNWATTIIIFIFIFPLFIWSIETKFDLVPPTKGVFVNLYFNYLPSWHITNAPQAHRLAPHMYHVSLKEGDLYNDMHLIYFTLCEILTKIQCPTLKGYMHRRLLCLMRSPFANRTLVGLPALPVRKPQLLCELWTHEGMPCLFLNPWDMFPIDSGHDVKKIWPWPQSHRLTFCPRQQLDLAWSQSQLLTFRPRHKYYLAWYLSPVNVHCCKVPPNFFSGSLALILVEILMIPATTSINFANLNLVFTTSFWNPT